MKFHNTAKRNLFRFINNIKDEKNLFEIKDYIISMKNYQDFKSYFDEVVEAIKPNDAEANREIKRKYCRIGGDLAIVAGLYYGDDLSLKHLERDYEISLSREELKQEVVKFTNHILFGSEASGVENVGDLQIEQEGLIPIMDRIITNGRSDEEQKNELMSYFRVYGILSEQSMQEAKKEFDKDPNVILARNTNNNRKIERIIINENSDENGKHSFAEKFAGKGFGENRKTVTFSLTK